MVIARQGLGTINIDFWRRNYHAFGHGPHLAVLGAWRETLFCGCLIKEIQWGKPGQRDSNSTDQTLIARNPVTGALTRWRMWHPVIDESHHLSP